MKDRKKGKEGNNVYQVKQLSNQWNGAVPKTFAFFVKNKWVKTIMTTRKNALRFHLDRWGFQIKVFSIQFNKNIRDLVLSGM